MVDSCISIASAMSLRIIGRMCSSPCSRNAVCRSTMERATFISVSLRISRLFSSQRASCSWARMRGVAGVAADQARVALVQAHARQRGGVDLHRPAVLGAAHEHIRDHVFGRARADDGARAADGRSAPAPAPRRALLRWRAARAAAATARGRRRARGDGGRSAMASVEPGRVAVRAAAAAARCTRRRERAPTPGGSSACTSAEHAARSRRARTRSRASGCWRSLRAIR